MTFVAGNVTYLDPDEIQTRLNNQLKEGLTALNTLKEADVNTAPTMEGQIIRSQNILSDLTLDATMGMQHYRDRQEFLIGKLMEEDPKLSAAKAEQIVSVKSDFQEASIKYNQYKALSAYLESKFKTFNNAFFSVSGANKRDQLLQQRN